MSGTDIRQQLDSSILRKPPWQTKPESAMSNPSMVGTLLGYLCAHIFAVKSDHIHLSIEICKQAYSSELQSCVLRPSAL